MKQQWACMMLNSIAFKFPKIYQYIADFEDLARKAGYTVGNNKTASLFLRGLWTLADVFERVIDKDPQNYFQLKDAAIAVTKNQQLLNALRRNTLGTNPFQRNYPRQSFFQRTPGGLGPPQGPPTTTRYNSSNTPPWIRNTPVPIDTLAWSQAPNNWKGWNPQYQGNVTQMEGTPLQTKGPCFKCGKMGHFARDCRSSRANYA